MSSAFSWFVIVGTLASLVAYFLVLYLNKNVSSPGQTTGHSYDGIEEYDNPLPAWWYWWFILTIVFGLGYLIYYPGLGNFPGIGQWTQISQLEQAQKAAQEKYGPIFARYGNVPIDELSRDPDAMKMGRRMFINNCAVCHGSQATGSFGFPNLTYKEWIWGGDGKTIETTITGGRVGTMPAWKDVLGDKGVKEVLEYVLSFTGRSTDDALVEKGKEQFMTICIACHGPDAKGNPLLGAPDLTNDIWLYGGSRDRIEYSIRNGRNGQMPTFSGKLSKDKIHILAAYVKSLGNGP
jgi:cytochrome c oxidase cbb3-type subunit 3